MANESVLIINDSQKTISFITDQALKPNGYSVLVAKNGQIGLQRVQKDQPDLVILAMNLSGKAGMDVLKKLIDKNITTPVILTAAQGSEALAIEAFRLGAKDYVLEPFDQAELMAAIERALSEQRLRKERDDLTQRLLASNKDLEQRVKELNTLFGIGKSVTALLDQDRLLTRLVEAAIYLTNAEESSLLLRDESSAELTMVAACGIDEQTVRSFRLPVNDSLAGEVITTGQPVILSGKEAAANANTLYPAHALIYVPLKVKGRVNGVLTVDNRRQARDFTNHDLRLLSTLADYAAISFENAQLFSQVESERTKLVTILTEIKEPVVVIGENERIIVANPAFCQIFSPDSRSVEGRLVAEQVYNPSLLKFAARKLPANQIQKDEILLSDGRTFYATLTSIPGVGRAIVMKDVTHFKELDRMKSDFVSTVSHDLRAPLLSIKDYTSMLPQIGQLSEKQELFVERIVNGADHVLALVDNLLDLSTIELGSDPNVIPVDLNQLSTETVAEFQTHARRNNQQLICHTAGEVAIVHGNPVRLKQVISNLIDNALKYTLPHGQIAALVQVDQNDITFKVEDTGIGIPPTDLPFIFDKFYRITSTNHGNNARGTGLGLAICKSIVEKYGGHIWAESQPGQGSTFMFSLPLAMPDQAIPVISPLQSNRVSS